MPRPASGREGAERFVPDGADLEGLREAARGCRGCDLYADATQTVFGHGPTDATMVLVGEQPGDREDREGEPFVGPAGRLLDTALADAGIDRGQVYVTNAVKLRAPGRDAAYDGLVSDLTAAAALLAA